MDEKFFHEKKKVKKNIHSLWYNLVDECWITFFNEEKSFSIEQEDLLETFTFSEKDSYQQAYQQYVYNVEKKCTKQMSYQQVHTSYQKLGINSISRRKISTNQSENVDAFIHTGVHVLNPFSL